MYKVSVVVTAFFFNLSKLCNKRNLLKYFYFAYESIATPSSFVKGLNPCYLLQWIVTSYLAFLSSADLSLLFPVALGSLFNNRAKRMPIKI